MHELLTIANKLSLTNIKYIDLGGGFKIDSQYYTYNDYIKSINQVYNNFGFGYQIIYELGNAYKAWKAEDEIELILPNYILQGIVDLAEYDKKVDVIDIVDYKTGPKPNTENDPHSTDHYRKQLEIYAYLMERKYNKPVRYMKLYYTSVTDGDPYIIFEYKKDRINSTISEITSTIEKIESKKFDDGVNNDYACRFCDMKYVCGKSEAMKGILS